jgi:hypothetical protein
MNRPSHKELSRKINLAKNAVSVEAINILNHIAVAADAIELGYDISDIKNVLTELLDEISPDYYAGGYPPQRSYDKQIENLDLFPFRWISRKFGCEIYLKFALQNGQLWVVSLHEHRVNKGGI